MYKVIIPPALAIMFASFVIVHVAVRAEDLTMLKYAWGMAAFSGLVFIALLMHFFLNGLHTLSELEKVKVERQEYEKKATRDALQGGGTGGHDPQWLSGFAKAAAFFIDNYLASENPGPTEMQWFQSSQEHFGFLEDCTEEENEMHYRRFMVAALCRDGGLSAKEYASLARLTDREGASKLLASVVYDPYTIDSMKDEFRQAMETAEEGGKR